jgi:hypothetical protein
MALYNITTPFGICEYPHEPAEYNSSTNFPMATQGNSPALPVPSIGGETPPSLNRLRPPLDARLEEVGVGAKQRPPLTFKPTSLPL